MDCTGDDKALSPPINPHRRLRNWPKSLYLFYDHLPLSLWTGSLYRIDLPEFEPKPEPEPEPISLSPTSVFPSDGGFATHMKCARLDSKVYFMGGQLISDDATAYELFPRDVYFLDLAAPTPIPTKLSAPLNAGKPNPIVFVAEKKVFVLGSWFNVLNTLDYYCKVNSNDVLDMREELMEGKLFECYDPVVRKWKVLEEPPLEYHCIELEGCAVLESHRLVLFIGWDDIKLRRVQFIYDLSTGKWAPLLERGCAFGDGSPFSDACVVPTSGGYSLYRLDDWISPIKSKFEIKKEGGNDLCSYECKAKDEDVASTLELVNNEFSLDVFRDPYINSQIQLLALGDGYFCHVVAGAPGRPEGPDPWGYLPPDSRTRTVKVVVFKDTSGEGTSGCDSFKAKVLYTKTFVMMKTTKFSEVTLVSSFVVSHDEQLKMKKKMKRKMKRNKSREEVVAQE